MTLCHRNLTFPRMCTQQPPARSGFSLLPPSILAHLAPHAPREASGPLADPDSQLHSLQGDSSKLSCLSGSLSLSLWSLPGVETCLRKGDTIKTDYILSQGDHKGMHEEVFPQAQPRFFYVNLLLENAQCSQMNSENLILQFYIVLANLGIEGYSRRVSLRMMLERAPILSHTSCAPELHVCPAPVRWPAQDRAGDWVPAHQWGHPDCWSPLSFPRFILPA